MTLPLSHLTLQASDGALVSGGLEEEALFV